MPRGAQEAAQTAAKGRSRGKPKRGPSRKRFVNLLSEREVLPKFKLPAWIGRKELRMLLELNQSDGEDEDEDEEDTVIVSGSA